MLVLRMLVALAAVVVAVTGCLGGGSSTATPSPTSQWRAGEYRPYRVPDLCSAVTRGTLVALHIRENVEGDNGDCHWHESPDRDGGHSSSDLSVGYVVHRPEEGTATEAAKEAYEQAGDDDQAPKPARGIGDQVKIYEWLGLDVVLDKTRQVTLVVREANVVLTVDVTTRSTVPPGRDVVAGFDEVESGALAVTREVLGELTGERVRTMQPRALAEDEVERVRSVCGSVPAARRLVPGAEPSPVAPKGAKRTSGCAWQSPESYYPKLSVYAEAVAPSRTRAQSATAAAHRFYAAQDHDTKRKVGDEASIRHSSYDDGDRGATVHVRRGNLLVAVDYGRGGHPTKKQMEREALRVAAQVLAANR